MLIQSISFPSPLAYIAGIYDDHIDGFVYFEDGSNYTVVAATCNNILALMDKEKINFSEPVCPFIIVTKLTMEVIEEAIEAYAKDDAYWLKLHHFAAEIYINVFDKLQKDQDYYN